MYGMAAQKCPSYLSCSILDVYKTSSRGSYTNIGFSRYGRA